MPRFPNVRSIRRRQNFIGPRRTVRNIPGRSGVFRRPDGYYTASALSYRVRGRPGTPSFDRRYYVSRRGR